MLRFLKGEEDWLNGDISADTCKEETPSEFWGKGTVGRGNRQYKCPRGRGSMAAAQQARGRRAGEVREGPQSQ